MLILGFAGVCYMAYRRRSPLLPERRPRQQSWDRL